MATPNSVSFREPRRRDRAVRDEAWIENLLHRAPVGVLAMTAAEGPKAVPNLFVFDSSRRSIYFHTARAGETRQILEDRPRVSFCVAEMGRLLPARDAVDFSVEYASVVVDGRSRVVAATTEARRALELFMRKYAPGLESVRDYRPVEARDLERTSVFRIDISHWSGKAKTSVAEDAYAYSPPDSKSEGSPHPSALDKLP